jgi:hypothetical protein
MSRPDETRGLSDLELVRKYEPILRLTQGELYFPTDVDRYIEHCSLWVNHRDGREEEILPEGRVTLDELALPRELPFGSVLFLRFSQAVSLNDEMRRALRERSWGGRALKRGWHPGPGRLARSGMLARLLDAMFALTLVVRGKVPGAVAALAEERSRAINATGEKYVYYARVIRDGGWIGLQYWYFYHYDDWRTSFEGANDHEADWETISVYLFEDGDGTLHPRWAVFSCHDFLGDDLRRRWDDREQLELVGDHPVAYVGAGSHAHYYRPGEYMIEAEIPPLARIAPFANAIRSFWAKTIQRAEDVTTGPSRPLAIPFVEYARGDGLSIGPGQAVEWEPVLLNPQPGWLTEYRGLWGLYARDPLGGENAPAGPMYSRDGTPRPAWFDLLAYSGLNRVPPPPLEITQLEADLAGLERTQEALQADIPAQVGELQSLGVRRQAMENQPNLKRDALLLDTAISELSDEINRKRWELQQNESIRAALTQRLARRKEGIEDPPHAHVKVMQTPSTVKSMRFVRLTELWSAITIGLLVVGIILLLEFAPTWVLSGGVVLFVAVSLIESYFRGIFRENVRRITVVLAMATLLVLLYEFIVPILIGGLLAGAVLLTWENLHDALAPTGTRKRKKQRKDEEE